MCGEIVRVFLNILGFLGCIILSVVLYLVVICLTFNLLIRDLISEKTIDKMFTKTDVLEISAKDLKIFGDDNGTIKEAIVNRALDSGVSKVLVLQVLDTSKFDMITTDFVSSYSKYMLTGGLKPKLISSSFAELIDAEVEKLVSQTGYAIAPSQTVKLKEEMSLYVADFNASIPDKRVVDERILHLFKVMYSPLFIAGCCCLILLIMLLYMLLRFKVVSPLIWGGIVLVLVGSSLTIIALLKTFIMTFFSNLNSVFSDIFGIISADLFKQIYFYGVGILLIGVGFIVLYNFFKKRIN